MTRRYFLKYFVGSVVGLAGFISFRRELPRIGNGFGEGGYGGKRPNNLATREKGDK
jgi:hypothetical protein